jgi:hypothetical protein
VISIRHPLDINLEKTIIEIDPNYPYTLGNSSPWPFALQAFYAERAFRLMHNNYIVLSLIVMGMACQASASIAVAVITARVNGFDQVEATKVVVYLWVRRTVLEVIL